MFELMYKTVYYDYYIVHLQDKVVHIKIYWPNDNTEYTLSEKNKEEIIKFLV